MGFVRVPGPARSTPELEGEYSTDSGASEAECAARAASGAAESAARRARHVAPRSARASRQLPPCSPSSRVPRSMYTSSSSRSCSCARSSRSRSGSPARRGRPGPLAGQRAGGLRDRLRAARDRGPRRARHGRGRRREPPGRVGAQRAGRAPRAALDERAGEPRRPGGDGYAAQPDAGEPARHAEIELRPGYEAGPVLRVLRREGLLGPGRHRAPGRARRRRARTVIEIEAPMDDARPARAARVPARADATARLELPGRDRDRHPRAERLTRDGDARRRGADPPAMCNESVARAAFPGAALGARRSGGPGIATDRSGRDLAALPPTARWTAHDITAPPEPSGPGRERRSRPAGWALALAAAALAGCGRDPRPSPATERILVQVDRARAFERAVVPSHPAWDADRIAIVQETRDGLRGAWAQPVLLPRRDLRAARGRGRVRGRDPAAATARSDASRCELRLRAPRPRRAPRDARDSPRVRGAGLAGSCTRGSRVAPDEEAEFVVVGRWLGTRARAARRAADPRRAACGRRASRPAQRADHLGRHAARRPPGLLRLRARDVAAPRRARRARRACSSTRSRPRRGRCRRTDRSSPASSPRATARASPRGARRAFGDGPRRAGAATTSRSRRDVPTLAEIVRGAAAGRTAALRVEPVPRSGEPASTAGSSAYVQLREPRAKRASTSRAMDRGARRRAVVRVPAPDRSAHAVRAAGAVRRAVRERARSATIAELPAAIERRARRRASTQADEGPARRPLRRRDRLHRRADRAPARRPASERGELDRTRSSCCTPTTARSSGSTARASTGTRCTTRCCACRSCSSCPGLVAAGLRVAEPHEHRRRATRRCSSSPASPVPAGLDGASLAPGDAAARRRSALEPRPCISEAMLYGERELKAWSNGDREARHRRRAAIAALRPRARTRASRRTSPPTRARACASCATRCGAVRAALRARFPRDDAAAFGRDARGDLERLGYPGADAKSDASGAAHGVQVVASAPCRGSPRGRSRTRSSSSPAAARASGSSSAAGSRRSARGRDRVAQRRAPRARCSTRRARADGASRRDALDVREPNRSCARASTRSSRATAASTCSSTTPRATSSAPPSACRANAWRAVLGIVLDGTFYCSQHFGARDDRARLGRDPERRRDVRLDRAWPASCTRASAKAGVLAMTRTLAVEWARHGIRVNAIAPGPVPLGRRARQNLWPDRRPSARSASASRCSASRRATRSRRRASSLLSPACELRDRRVPRDRRRRVARRQAHVGAGRARQRTRARRAHEAPRRRERAIAGRSHPRRREPLRRPSAANPRQRDARRALDRRRLRRVAARGRARRRARSRPRARTSCAPSSSSPSASRAAGGSSTSARARAGGSACSTRRSARRPSSDPTQVQSA